ncbi:E3 ubiquitin-protein ligase Topors-like [Ascaphus truei]|uniref:E3 ubiquitin-protein ligase Topors-like n=1 Tax=Ascaphus truei TaxID=8439 RepID=UPI003F596206
MVFLRHVDYNNDQPAKCGCELVSQQSLLNRSQRRPTSKPDEEVMASTEELMVDGSFSPQADTSQVHSMPAVASPDSKCSICLDRFDNVSHLDPCRHRFCFSCIKEWAKTKTECPLCKQPFRFNYHSVQADDDYKEYILNGTFVNPDGNQFQYCTTFVGNCHQPIHPLTSSSSRMSFTPPDSRILFDGRSNQMSMQSERDIHQMIQRLASRRQASAEGRFLREITEEELITFRRALYHSGVRVRNIQDGGQYRNISAQFFRRNSASFHRLIPWLKRELTVLLGSYGSLTTIVQHIIISNVTKYDLESQAFVEDLRPFLQHHTDHFQHEFINFACCPYDIEAYDQNANYDCPAPSIEKGSCSEASIIISPDEAEARYPDVPSSALRLSPWDNETPGTSYSTLNQITANASTTIDSSESSDEEPSINRATTQVDIKMDTIARMQDTEAYSQHGNYDSPAQSSIITISSDEEDIGEPDVPSFALGLGQDVWDNETLGTFYSTLNQTTATASTTIDSSESSDEEPSINRATTQVDIKMDTIARMQDTEAYGQHGNYDSHAQSSIMTRSSDEEDVREPDVSSSALRLGQTTWDNETPGTSYSTLNQTTATASTTIDSSEISDKELSINRATTQVDTKMDTIARMQDSRSSTPASFTLFKDKCALKDSHKDSTSSDKHCYSKKKEKRKRPVDVSSQDTREARKKRKLAYLCPASPQ